MRDYLKHYHMRITALAPIHVGGGGKLSKKEYIQQSARTIIVPDTDKMLRDLQSMRLDGAYADFMLNDSYRSADLGRWLRDHRIGEQYVKSWKKYSMDPGDAFIKRQNGTGGTPKDILTFMKDPYGCPYIPGSTLKGMLRTAIICRRVHQKPNIYAGNISAIADAAPQRAGRNSYLKRQTAELESAVLHTPNREERQTDAVNSVMSGFIVSDSKPLDLSQLILAQKIDYTLRGDEKPLPILREALKPGSQIDFELTIDTKLCDITIEEIFEALKYFRDVVFNRFYKRFDRGSNADGIVWLGGGCGFLSKTILYPVCGENAVKIADMVFSKNYSVHRHTNDVTRGIAPHVCKCTRYGGQLYDMGMGKIELIR